MARLDLAYARSLLRIAEPADLMRVVVQARRREALARGRAAARRRRGHRRRRRCAGPRAAHLRRPPAPSAERYRDALPRGAGALPHARRRHPGAPDRVFGEPRPLGDVIDWKRDPLTGRRCDGEGLFPDGVDPKGCWELARVGHLVELGAAARSSRRWRPRRAPRWWPRSARSSTTIRAAAASTTPRRSRWRCARVHWLAAVELCGGAAAFPRAFVEKLAARAAATTRTF